MFRHLLAFIRRHPVVAGCILFGAAVATLRLQGRPNPLAQALGELPPDQQRVIYLRFVADFDTRTIAQIMGKREDDIRMLQLQALRRLFRVLAT